MIEIIKMGTKHKVACKECGCYFSYEDSDVQHEDIDNYKAFRSFVKCPQCGLKVMLKQTR